MLFLFYFYHFLFEKTAINLFLFLFDVLLTIIMSMLVVNKKNETLRHHYLIVYRNSFKLVFIDSFSITMKQVFFSRMFLQSNGTVISQARTCSLISGPKGDRPSGTRLSGILAKTSILRWYRSIPFL